MTCKFHLILLTKILQFTNKFIIDVSSLSRNSLILNNLDLTLETAWQTIISEVNSKSALYKFSL